MRRIHKVIAVCGSSALLTLTLTPAALAAGSARSGAGGGVGRALTLPNSNIKGSPAHFSPSSLTAKARWDGVPADCGAQASFTLNNTENKSETVTLSGKGLKTNSGTIPAKTKVGVCISKGYHGTAHLTLKDGKKLNVTFP